MAKTSTTNNTDTTGTLINGAYGRAGATARVKASQVRALEEARLAVRIGV